MARAIMTTRTNVKNLLCFFILLFPSIYHFALYIETAPAAISRLSKLGASSLSGAAVTDLAPQWFQVDHLSLDMIERL